MLDENIQKIKNKMKEEMSSIKAKTVIQLVKHDEFKIDEEKFFQLTKQMTAGQAETWYLKIKFHDHNHRSVHALADIKKGETILYVPGSQIIIIEEV